MPHTQLPDGLRLFVLSQVMRVWSRNPDVPAVQRLSRALLRKKAIPYVCLTENINPFFSRMSDIDIQPEYRMHEMFGQANTRNANNDEPRTISFPSWESSTSITH